jgi:hypothetical protein
MSCANFTPDQVNSLIAKATDLYNKVQNSRSTTDTDMLDDLETKLADAKNNYATAGASLNAAKANYTINRYGRAYYYELQQEESARQLKINVEDNIEYFLLALNSSEKELDLLDSNINQLSLIKKIFSTTPDSLNDIFGFDISPFDFKQFNMEGFETSVLNRKIYYESERINNIDMINKILFFVYYILSIVSLGVLYNSTIKGKILVGLFFIIYPFLNIFVFIFVFFYNIFKIIYNFIF